MFQGAKLQRLVPSQTYHNVTNITSIQPTLSSLSSLSSSNNLVRSTCRQISFISIKSNKDSNRIKINSHTTNIAKHNSLRFPTNTNPTPSFITTINTNNTASYTTISNNIHKNNDNNWQYTNKTNHNHNYNYHNANSNNSIPNYLNISKTFLSTSSSSNSNSDTNNATTSSTATGSNTTTITADSTNSPSSKGSKDTKDNTELSEKIDKRAYPIALSSLLMGTAIGIIIPIMPAFATDLGMNTLEYGLVISVMGWTRLVFNIPSAYWADKYGRRPLLIGGPLLSATGMCMTSIVTSFNGLLASRFIVGAGGSLQMAGAQTYLADISNYMNRARTMAPMQLGFSAGMALGPALGGILADVLSVRQTFLITGVAIFGACLNNTIMCPETKPKNIIDNKQSDKGIYETTKITIGQWKQLLKNKNNQCAFLMHTMFWTTSSGIMFTLMPLFAANELHMSATQLGELFGMLALVNVFGAQPMAWVSDKFGRKSVIVPASGILSCSVISLPFVTNVTELAVLCTFWAIGSTMIAAGPMAYIADNNSNENRSQALAALRSGGDLGLMMGSGVLGFLAYNYDLTTASVVGATCLLTGGVNFALRAGKPRPHHHIKI